MRTDDRTAAFANFVSGENSLCTTVSISRFHIVSRGVEIEKECPRSEKLSFLDQQFVTRCSAAVCGIWKLLKTWEALSFYVYMFPFIYIRFLFIYIWHRVFGLKGKLVPPILKEGHGSNTSACPTHYVHGSPDSSLITLPLANIGKDSFPTNPLHAHVARLHSKQETTFSMIANATNNHGTPNETPSKTSSHSWIITQAHFAFKKASHSSSSTILLYIAMHLILSFPILFSNFPFFFLSFISLSLLT